MSQIIRFIVNIECAFQDKEFLYLSLELMTGSDLRYHLNKKKLFTEKETSFLISVFLLPASY